MSYKAVERTEAAASAAALLRGHTRPDFVGGAG